MPRVQLLQPLRGLDGLAEKKRAEKHATSVALQYLAQHWPEAFSDDTAQAHPLAIGAGTLALEHVANDPNAPDPKWIRRALAIWTSSEHYLRALARGRSRVNLDGSFAARVDPEHVEHARQRLAKLRDRGRARAAQRKAIAAQAAPAPRAPTPPAPPPLGLGRPTLTLKRRTA